MLNSIKSFCFNKEFISGILIGILVSSLLIASVAYYVIQNIKKTIVKSSQEPMNEMMKNVFDFNKGEEEMEKMKKILGIGNLTKKKKSEKN